MKQKEFDRLCIEMFGTALRPAGFSNEGSQYCSFSRKVTEDIYNVIIPDIGSRGVWYDVKVAPVSPKLDPLFHERFPDSIGMFTANLLNKYEGVGITQQQFNCKSAENFERVFKRDVEPLLIGKALPFLDGIRTIEDLLPFIRHDLMRGLALHAIGRVNEARPLLEKQRQQLAGKTDPALMHTVEHLDTVLSKL